ncbi:MAG TPA: serine--tRNA ligase [Novosphingobium sp.]|nr:serine--tRNA ligase [Novosphingobium sp.]HNN55744.1 serine--tRNA ligase [Novosphingobium sp.]
MHDIKFIRENPAAFDAALARRGLEPQSAALLALDADRRAVATQMQEAQNRRNEASKLIGQLTQQLARETSEFLSRSSTGIRFDRPQSIERLESKIEETRSEVAALKDTLPALEAQDRDLLARLSDTLARIPNLPAADVPDGADEADNVELLRWGTPRSFDFVPLEHADLGPALGMDFETGAAISGARFTFLRGAMARLHRAIGQFMLDTNTTQGGYSECNTPVLVRDEAMYGTDKLPKFAEDSFRTTDGRWLIPTSEVSLTSSVMDRILDDAALPMRMTALTLCFRSEAGAAGKDTRGFIRQHQFEKCELVSIVRPEESEAEHERMTGCAEAILQALELPYRKIALCTGDMGFGARKTYDLEVWLPGQNAYREISSCSNCGDFQARRMNARFRPEGQKGTQFVHTLNGSGLAVGRTLVAVLENYQQADGSVTVPVALRPYMGGLEALAAA